MLKFTRKRAAAVGVIAALAVAGAAYAYWTTTGSGTGSATTGTDKAVAVTQTSTVSGLVPGGAAQAIDFKINNPSSTPQYISNVAVSISSITKDGSVAAGCSTDDFALVQPNAINKDLASGDTQFDNSGASLKMVNKSTNQDGCKGVTVNLAFAAS
jgi:hypothetical protein